MTGYAPKVRAIVDVKRGMHAVSARDLEGLQRRRLHLWVAQMSAGCHDRAGALNELWIDIVHRQTHIRTILAVENEWKPFLIPDAQQNEGRQPLRVSFHTVGVHTLALQLLTDEPSHMLVTNARDYC